MVERVICFLFGHSNPIRSFIIPPYFVGIDGMTSKKVYRSPIQPKNGFWQCTRCGKLMVKR